MPYRLSVEREFCAGHAILINGSRESYHGHNWRVTVTVGGSRLDQDGLLMDFHQLERDLDQILEPFHNVMLNDVQPFDQMNPTAEHVAQFIGESIARTLPAGVNLHSVRISEAPGCAAVYLP